ncbi:MAG: hypothetical protein ACXITV_06330 [Luteibaculaceae bacterium]
MTRIEKIQFCNTTLGIVTVNNNFESNLLHKELELYGKSKKEVDFYLHFLPYKLFSDEIKEHPYKVYTFKNASVAISKSENKGLFCLIPHKNILYKGIQKFTSNQFTVREEYIGQIFHELVLPILFSHLFFATPIHGAAFNYNGKTFLIGGEGGVGKTSIELELCYNKQALFITDDIAFLNGNTIYPNFNYPKIYKYNLENKKSLEELLTKDFGFFRKLHWKVFQLIFNKPPRIRINPTKYFKVGSSSALDYYFIVERTNSQKQEIEMEKLSAIKAAEVSAKIMRNEFKAFDFENSTFQTIEKELIESFKTVNTYRLIVSKSLGHSEYLKKMTTLIHEFAKK